VSQRASDLTTDQDLLAISRADMLPLSILLNDSKLSRVISSGNTSTRIQGVDSVLSDDIMKSTRAITGLAKAVIARNQFAQDCLDMIKQIGPIVYRSPWYGTGDQGCFRPLRLNPAGWAQDAVSYITVKTIKSAADFYARSVAETPGVAGHFSMAYGHSADRSSFASTSISAGNALDAGLIWTGAKVTIHDTSSEVYGSVYTYHSVAASKYGDIQFRFNGVTTAVIPRNGSNVGTIALAGGASVSYSEYETGLINVGALVFKVSGMAVGDYDLSFLWNGNTAAGVNVGLNVTFSPPIVFGNRQALDDNRRLELLKDIDMLTWMIKFIRMRNEVASSVTENQWMKSYHRYIFGATPAYSTPDPLNETQLLSIKGRMLAVNSWSDFSDLDGFIKKVHSDVWSIYALVQSTNFED
jgi:hypothetical protein